MEALIACAFCDRLHSLAETRAEETVRCSRCRAPLAKGSANAIEGTLAMALAAAVLLLVANVFPFLHVSLEGQSSENTIASGVFGLWQGGLQALAVLVLFTTVAAPALRILGLLYVLIPLSLGRVPPGVAGALRFQETLVSWAMLDVYMLATLVTLVKLSQMAQVQLEAGAYAFVGLFLVLALLGSFYDRRAVWERVEALR